MDEQQPPFELLYAPIVREQLRAIEPKHYSLIHQTVEEQLLFEPDVETRNRKPLKRPAGFGGVWELRFGANNRFRLFHEVDRNARRVRIVAIGEKRGERLFVGGREVKV
jgi:mRNA-degrading endonuclease RelE of RelBE toxin-antitoxin system